MLIRLFNTNDLIGCGSSLTWCTGGAQRWVKVHSGVLKCIEECIGLQRGAQRCVEVYRGVCRGTQRGV